MAKRIISTHPMRVESGSREPRLDHCRIVAYERKSDKHTLVVVNNGLPDRIQYPQDNALKVKAWLESQK
jgi:hypothetical protein